MADHTGIEWAEATWNPVVGCSLFSPGCTHCYAMKMAARVEAMGGKAGAKYRGLTRASKAGPVWTGTVRLDEAALLQPLRWKRPRRIFVNSMSDLFHEDLLQIHIDQVFAVMALAPQHTFIVLTKRAERMRHYMKAAADWVRDALLFDRAHRIDLPFANIVRRWDGTLAWPLPNVIVGVSVEDQVRADERIPLLLQTPAAIRIVSSEPLLGPLDLSPWLSDDDGCETCDDGAGLALNRCSRRDIPREEQCPRNLAIFDYIEHGPYGEDGTPSSITQHRVTLDGVIVGGESGTGARPMHPDWARGLRDQCVAAGTSYFFKQWGEWAPNIGAVDGWTIADDPEISRFAHREWEDGRWSEDFHPAWFDFQDGNYDEENCVSRIGKRRAGRLLDGRTWDEMPEVAR